MTDFQNEFSWSKSRAEKFTTCLRKYYLHHYGSWGGWDRNADPELREIYVMKNLRSIPMWIGSAVHENIEWLINLLMRSSTASLEQSLVELRHEMTNQWNKSASGKYRQRPNRLLGLFEHYYDFDLNESDFETAYHEAAKCIHNLFKKSVYQFLDKEKGISILQTENMDSMQMDGVKVWVVADLILNWNDWLYIIDWKTGKDFGGDEVDLQLAIYALYGSLKWRKPPEQIMVHQSNLRLGQYERTQMSSEKTNWVRTQIKQSADQMRSLLVDPVNNIARMENFPMNEDAYACRYCNFKRACKRT